jgi:predicted nucleic acid-binding protein
LIVVDASAALLGLLNDGDARRRMMTEELATPHLIDSEVAHALRAQVARRRIDEDDALRVLRRWTRLGIRRHGVNSLLPRIWELRHNLSAYDATYVALAEAVASPVLTGDARLAVARGVRCEMLVVRS